MKQLLILSGKGGTGKTTVAGAFIELSRCSSYADCDVEAPNLQLTVAAALNRMAESDFYALGKAVIDPSVCTRCGECEKACRFDAIQDCHVVEAECEGCGVCERICPAHAVLMVDRPSGMLQLYGGPHTVFSTARLKTGGGTSGKLVAAVKKQLADHRMESGFIIVDGAPGIGCPVMASMSGADQILVVTEPTVSGLHDMKRVLELAAFFRIPGAVCINRYDISPSNTGKTEAYCRENHIPVIGKIPFDKTVIQAVNNRRTIAAYPDSPAGRAVITMWHTYREKLTG